MLLVKGAMLNKETSSPVSSRWIPQPSHNREKLCHARRRRSLQVERQGCVEIRHLLAVKQGMQAVFRKMAERRDGYDFIHPVRPWKDWQDLRTERRAAEVIEQIMGEL